MTPKERSRSKPGHTEKQAATVAAQLVSGKWLQEREGAIKSLNTGMRSELFRFPAPAINKFVNGIVMQLALSEAVQSALPEDKRVDDLKEIIEACQCFLDIAKRLNVLADPVLQQYRSGSDNEGVANRVDAFVSRTKTLQRARNEAFAAVSTYKEELSSALDTARQRARGEKRTADEDGFFKQVARVYLSTFKERPTSTPGKEFTNIVIRIREFQTGEMPKDVSRIVAAAIKDL